MIRVAIIGASGYTGAEAIRILLRHNQADITYLTALPEECGPVEEIFPEFKGKCSLPVEPLDFDKLGNLANVVLCCLPHKVSMGFVPRLLKIGLKVVDLSADYRIKNSDLYQRYYDVEHTDTENLKKSVYGLPELFREEIKWKNLVANPGCFPTGLLLGIAPLLKEGLIDTQTIINNAVTGSSGAGRNPSSKFHFPNMNENLFAYSVGFHRHTPEMEEVATTVAGKTVKVLFQPHVGCFDRGILSTIYCQPKSAVDSKDLLNLYNDFYSNEPFVQVCGAPPMLKTVTGTNQCHVFPAVVGDKVVVFSTIDNLVKGASGQAIQNMNIIFDIEETTGLA